MATDKGARDSELPHHHDGAVSDREETTGSMTRPVHRFLNLTYLTLAVTVFVIVFGAFVRASLSGDGCGTSWPHCGETIIPDGSSVAAIIEFSHRTTSGLAVLLALAVVIASRRVFTAGHPARKTAGWSLAFVLGSGFIGMLLVVFEWVKFDVSLGRVITMPLHLLNTYMMLGALAMTAYYASGGERATFKGQGPVGTGLKWALGGMFVLGMTGAISAMGKTAFQSHFQAANTFMERMSLHIGDGAHPLLKGGALHPLMATSVGVIVVFACLLVMQRRQSAQVDKWARATIAVFIVQMVFGTANLLMSAPVWMQMTHLLLAITDWMCLVMLAVHALAARYQTAEIGEPAPSEATPKRPFRELVKDYVALTKPRVISLLLFTTLAAMFIAQGGAPGFWLIVGVMIGGYMAAGSANTFNMVVERDLDLAMERTSHRPTVGQRISNRDALIFASVLGVGSFALLSWTANVLAAVMALCGLLCYVFVYTLWLKRRTWHNIVIGGAAGAFPPLVGYAAVSGELNMLAWFLFALIFTWTPVHFWALAILIKDDYAKAGVPMLPVVKGDKVTVVQILLYAVLTALISVFPLVTGELGPVYLVGAGLLNLFLVLASFRLFQDTSRTQARLLFKFSMVYLALFFVVIAVDRMVAV